MIENITSETRREGYEHISARSGAIACRVMAALEASEGMTANEISKATGISLNNVRSRLTELFNAGRVTAVGKKKNPETGINIAVWKVV